MRYFIIAGEQSGDLHGSNLIKALHSHDKEASVFCWGGEMMEEAGATLLMHYKNTAIMGFTAIIQNLGKFISNLELCKKQIWDYSPDAVILIDFPGFNMRIAEYCKRKGFKVLYYISPKFWAWGEWRVRKVKRYVDRMFIIFPFETEFYARHGIRVQYLGNPLVDEVERQQALLPDEEEIYKICGQSGKPVIALLAGSRKHEVLSILPQMVKLAGEFHDYHFVVAGVKNLPDELYQSIIGDEPVSLVKDKTYKILKVADAALVASGTATLETALFNVPQVVCYKGDFFSMLVAWVLIKVKFISLVNLILKREVIKELVGYSLNRKNLIRELKAILPGGDKREKILSDYDAIRFTLGSSGASDRIAGEMVRVLRYQE
ncbi:MAG TPA: lipid-A-disaccharide synthase [Bacteroidales bacterium]|nr:lipid-A-disaccharide synthase [Bacteroidales bacterium]HPI68398.1 lipid-A-disaccharide synthase [Bacteroidales bacterium]HPR73089.1 lipid-A-disaccharide synthase [Bacteroidales bacterium]